MIVGKDEDEAKSGARSTTVTWYPEEFFKDEVS
jgi:hypothetical protein